MIKKLLNLAIILALIVIVLGAYTRLKDAGLGCPDWPGCYGQLIAPIEQTDINQAESLYPNSPYETEKAWTEMVHRYCAGTLGLIVFGICFLIFKNRKKLPPKIGTLAYILALLIVFQALLGMWTVTMRLYPIVVMGHLLGGFSVVSILWWLRGKLSSVKLDNNINSNLLSTIKPLALLSLIFLIVQLALGGWVSSNYAAVVCNDFPTCQGSWLPEFDFKTAFNLFNAGIFDSPGVALENTARVTIQMSHRIGALIVSILVPITCFKLWQTKNQSLSKWASILMVLLLLQLTLGISNVLAGLPLWVAVMHNGVGALLLLTLIKINQDLIFIKKQNA